MVKKKSVTQSKLLNKSDYDEHVSALTKTIVRSVKELSKLVPDRDDKEAHERIRELEFQNNTLALRIQQLESTLSAIEHSGEDKQALLSKGSWLPKTGSFTVGATATVHVNDESTVTTGPMLTRTSSQVFRVRSDSVEKVPAGDVKTDGEIINDELKKRLSPDVKEKKTTKTDSKTVESGLAQYRLLMCSDETCDIMEPTDNVIKIEHMTRTLIRLMWKTEPKCALIIKKPNDQETTDALEQVAKFLHTFGVKVLVEHYVQDELRDDAAKVVTPCTREKIKDGKADFVVCLGGDGTILWASSIFTEGVPPLVSFSLGSLGFLTPFPVTDIEKIICKVMGGGFVLTLRSRLVCEVHKQGCVPESYTVLNEVVVDRGVSSSLVHVQLFVGNRKTPITDVQGDGIIVSTPTGSTAYSLAAGGCMIHPAIPAMVVTPICPHSLSFRPFVIADATFLKLEVPMLSRSSAWVSFDGRNRVELQRGDSVVCKVSQYPVPAICRSGESDDWFSAIKSSFLWNERTVQKKV